MPATDPLQERAEAVRAYLVSVRGGAPLLSSTDARILHGWLRRGVRIGAIVRGIDVAAARRLAQKVRAPLSLASCKGEVEKQQNRAGAWVRGPRPLPEAPPVDARFTPVDTLAATTLARIAALVSTGEARLAEACTLAATFFEDAWALAPHDVLLSAAEARFGELEALVGPEEWESVLEAGARDELRRRYPQLTATWLAEEADGGVE